MNTTSDLSPIPRCNLGNLVAEQDTDLKQRYETNEFWEMARDLQSPKMYFIGRKGMGKSALLQMIRLTALHDHVVDLGSQDIGLALLTLGSTMQALPEAARRLLFRCAWLAALMTSIYQRIGVKQSGWSKTGAQKAMDVVSSHTASERGQTSIFAVLAKSIETISANIQTGRLALSLDFKLGTPEATKAIAQTQLLHSISLAADHLHELIKPTETYVLIDDLDRSWSNDAIQNMYLAGLFEAIEKLCQIPTIKFVVALRSDIFRNLPLDNPDKLVQHVQRLHWSPKVLRRIILSRLKGALAEPEPRIIKRFVLAGPGDPLAHVIQLCFPHPRDLIWAFQTLLDSAGASGSSTVDQASLDHATQEASSNRIAWICSEWRHTFPWLPNALKAFAGGVNLFTLELLRTKLASTASGRDLNLVIQGLLETGVLGLKYRRDDRPEYFISADPPPPPLGINAWFEIHPAIRAPLQSGRWSAPE